MDDWARSIIGIGIGFGCAITLILAWAYRSVPDAQAISASMTAIIGTILGYYFGAKGVDAAQNNAADQAALKGGTETAADYYQRKVQNLILAQKAAHPEVFTAAKETRAKDARTASIDNAVTELETLSWRNFLNKV